MDLESRWDPDHLATLSKEQLKIERAKLLERINAIEQNGKNDKEVQAYIEHLWNTNNLIVDLLRNFHPMPRLDPAEKLPLELFRTIIIEAITGSSSIPPEKTNNSLILTLVSERWRDILLAIPQIWNEILVSVHHDDCASKFFLFLKLSKPLPIHLEIHDWQVGDLDILPTLSQCRDRIKKITVSGGYGPSPQPGAQAALNALDQLSPLRNLKYLFYLGDDGPNQPIHYEILKRFNTLHEIPGLMITPDLFRHESIRHLRSATIQGDLDILNMVHSSMPMLNTVIFNQNDLFRGHESYLVDNLNQTQIDESPSPWSYLSCWYHSPSMARVMHDAMPRLVNLSTLYLTLSLPQLQTILVGIRHLSVLERLYLRFITVPGDQIEPFSTEDIRPNPRVKSLELDTSDFVSIEGFDDHRKDLEINKALIKAVPAIEWLKLLYPSGLEALGCHDWREFTNMTRIHLKNWSELEFQAEYELPMSLRWVHLEISHRRFSDFLSSKATSFSFQPSELEDSLGIAIYAREWPELRSFVTCAPFRLYGQDSKFTHLKSIIISKTPGSSVTDSPYDEVINVTRVCIQIALNSADLPSLEDLDMGCSPHWDILLLMLKTRNLVNKGRFVPLKNLWIPIFPKELETVLWSLMNGRNPEWPSLYDISLHGILELLEEDSV
jgi:hypothetical protein